MTAFPTFSITLTAEQFTAMQAKLEALGYGQQSLESGRLPKTHGVVLSYQVAMLDRAPTATFTVEEKPFFVTAAMIERGLRQMIGIG